MAIFDLPAGARPGRDTPVGQDELGRMVYRTATGQQYTMPEPPRMAPRAAGPMQGPLAYASPQRMAEMSAYASDLRGMQGSYSPQDIAAAGYSPMEVASFTTAGRPAVPFSQEADRDRQRAPADVLQEPDYTMRQEATYKLQDELIKRLGMDEYEAGRYARRVMGDPNAAGILESMGLIDIASMLGGSASLAAKGIGLAGRAVAAAPAALSGLFNVEEGTQTAQRGYQEGSALQTGLGAVQAVAGMAEMFPASKLIAESISSVASKMDPNTLYSVFGPPIPPQPVRAPDTGAGSGRPPLTFDEVDRAMQEAPAAKPSGAVIRPDNLFRGSGPIKNSLKVATKPYAVRVTGQSQIDDMIQSGMVRPPEGGYAGKPIVYFDEMDEAAPKSILYTPKSDPGKGYSIVMKSENAAGREGPISLDDLEHIWTLRDGEMVDILDEVRAMNREFDVQKFNEGGRG